MWDSALYDKLIGDSELAQFVSTFSGKPSVFSDSAPENVDFPYIVFTINGSTNPDSVVDTFSVEIAHFDFYQSAKRSRLAIRRAIELLDREHLTHSYYQTIRIYRTWSGSAARENEDRDPRARHYIARFTARAGRKGWIENLIPGLAVLTSPKSVTAILGDFVGTVTLTWQAADRSIDYEIEITNIDTGTVYTGITTALTIDFELTAKANPLRMTYMWRVRARAGTVYGAWTDKATFWTTYFPL